jgi:hypothetical protein
VVVGRVVVVVGRVVVVVGRVVVVVGRVVVVVGRVVVVVGGVVVVVGRVVVVVGRVVVVVGRVVVVVAAWVVGGRGGAVAAVVLEGVGVAVVTTGAEVAGMATIRRAVDVVVRAVVVVGRGRRRAPCVVGTVRGCRFVAADLLVPGLGGVAAGTVGAVSVVVALALSGVRVGGSVGAVNLLCCPFGYTGAVRSTSEVVGAFGDRAAVGARLVVVLAFRGVECPMGDAGCLTVGTGPLAGGRLVVVPPSSVEAGPWTVAGCLIGRTGTVETGGLVGNSRWDSTSGCLPGGTECDARRATRWAGAFGPLWAGRGRGAFGSGPPTTPTGPVAGPGTVVPSAIANWASAVAVERIVATPVIRRAAMSL